MCSVFRDKEGVPNGGVNSVVFPHDWDRSPLTIVEIRELDGKEGHVGSPEVSQWSVRAYRFPWCDGMDVAQTSTIERDYRSVNCELQRDYDFMVRDEKELGKVKHDRKEEDINYQDAFVKGAGVDDWAKELQPA